MTEPEKKGQKEQPAGWTKGKGIGVSISNTERKPMETTTEEAESDDGAAINAEGLRPGITGTGGHGKNWRRIHKR